MTTVSFHPDGHLLATGTSSGSVNLYDLKTTSLAHTFPPTSAAPITALSFSENGTWLASSTHSESAVHIWDLRGLKLLKTLDMGTAIAGVAFDYTGQFLAAAGLGGVVVSQYAKKSKAWSEPLRKAVGGGAVDVAWGPNAQAVVVLTGEGAISVLSA